MGAFLGGALGGYLLESGGIQGVLWFMVVVLGLWLLVALTMPAPGHTTSFVVQLQQVMNNQYDDIDDNLRRLPGVQDVVIVEEPKPEPPVSAAPPSELSSREQGERVSAI